MATKHTYSKEALLDIHKRTHQSLSKLCKHCAELDAKQLNKKLKGFGVPTVQQQLFHLAAAEYYWISVAKGEMDVLMSPEDYPTVKDLASFLRRTGNITKEYIDKASLAELNTARMMTGYGGRRKKLTPAHIVLRTQTHAFHHLGQVLAMCRHLGHPGPRGMDFPLNP
jgi:uncharacterized damage-inducible protein DinB